MMPFGFDPYDTVDDAAGFDPSPEPMPASPPAVEPPAPMPEETTHPAPATETDLAPGESPSDPEPETERDAGARAPRPGKTQKAPRMNERLADAILSTRRMLDDPTVHAAMVELTGRGSDEELTALMLRIRHGMNGRPPERRQVRDLLHAADRLRDGRLRDVLARASGHDTDARLALTLLDGRVEGADLLVAAHDEPDPVTRVTMLLSAGMRNAQRLRAAARLLVALDPALSERVRPQGGSQMDLAGAIAQTVTGVDVDPVRGLA